MSSVRRHMERCKAGFQKERMEGQETRRGKLKMSCFDLYFEKECSILNRLTTG